MFIGLPAAGPAIRRFGVSRTVFAALCGYLGGIVVTVTAHNAAVFAIGGLAQGAAACVLAVFGFGAVIRLFNAELRTRLIAVSSAVWIAPALAGPPVALWLDHLIGWRWTLLTPFPLVVLGRALAAPAARTASAQAGRTGRRRAALTLLVPAGVTLLIAGTSGGPWPLAPVGLAAAVAGAGRLLPAGTARARAGPPAAVLAMLLFATGYFGAQSLVTILMTTGRGGSLAAAGIALTSGALGWSLASLAVPRLTGTSQRRARRAVTGGLALAAVGIAALAAAGTGAVLAIAAWAIASIGVGFAYPALYRFCTDAPVASADAPGASAEDLAAAVIVAESFGGLLGRSLGAGIVSVTAIAGVAPSAGLSAAYAFFAVAIAVAVAASTRLAPVKRYEDPAALTRCWPGSRPAATMQT